MFGKGNKPTELSTIDTDEEIAKKEVLDNAVKEFVAPITAITFFDYTVPAESDTEPTKYIVNNIMSVPTYIQSLNNIHSVINSDMYERVLSIDDLEEISYRQNDIHLMEFLGYLRTNVYDNMRLFVDNSEFLALVPACRDQIMRNLYNQLFLDKDNYYKLEAIFNNFFGNMHSSYDGEKDENHMDRMISLMTIFSKQVIDMITYMVCYATWQAIRDFNPSVDYMNKLISDIKDNMMINPKFANALKNSLSLKSFLDNGIANELQSFIMHYIAVSIRHLCDNYYISTYYVYDDMYKDKKEDNCK